MAAEAREFSGLLRHAESLGRDRFFGEDERQYPHGCAEGETVVGQLVGIEQLSRHDRVVLPQIVGAGNRD